MKKHTELLLQKTGLTLLHLAAFILFIAGISLLYTNNNFKKGLSWMNSETYENSPAFMAQFESDINDIFAYIKYKNAFEENGVFSLDSEIFSINISPGKDPVYTLKDIIDYAKSHGYYINEKYQSDFFKESDSGNMAKKSNPPENAALETSDLETSGTEASNAIDEDISNANTSYLVNWRTYKLGDRLKEPGDAYMTIDRLIRESLDKLGAYYSAYNRLILNPTNIRYRLVYGSESYTNDVSLNDEDMERLGRYAEVDSGSMIIKNNLSKVPQNLSLLAAEMSEELDAEYKVIIAVDTGYQVKDQYYYGRLDYLNQRNLYFYGMVLTAAGLIFMAITIIMLGYLAGVPFKNAKTRRVYAMDRFGIEIDIILCLLSIMVFLYIGEKAGSKLLHVYLAERNWNFAEKLMQYIFVYGCVLFWLFSIIRAIKAGIIWESSLIKKIKDELSIYGRKQPYKVGISIKFALYLFLNVIFIMLISLLWANENTLIQRFIVTGIIMLCIIINIAVFHNMYKKAIQTDKIAQALHFIANGDTAYKLNLNEFDGKEADTAESINNIGCGLENAINEQVKSERLKADLITNVSHDIKTPLTSIINYVGLIKRENIINEKVKVYLDILESKSNHLKNLTEDLVEASKVSSGNISVDIAKLDLVEMIQQTNGEFEEKYLSNELHIISELPDEPVLICADGRHLWRVLENLYNNAFKYAIKGSRVYITISCEKDYAVFTMKNVSENPLNISPEELTERFVRGDVSRASEGSGLGLSIAKSLTLLQEGKFEIQIDGDLFKVMLRFKLAEQAIDILEEDENK